MRQNLNDSLSPRRFVAYAEAGGWATQVLDVLDHVGALTASGSPAKAKSLLEGVFDRLAGALAEVDDSGGEGMEIIERAAALHLETCEALGPDPAGVANELLERACNDEFRTFDAADETYADVLGQAGLAEFHRLAEAAYACLPAPGQDARATQDLGRQRVVAILDRFAERAGDLDHPIALRRAMLTGAHDYLSLSPFCLEQGRPALALEVAQDGAWLFEDRSATPLIALLAELLAAAGRRDEAVAALWRGFETDPVFSLFEALLQLQAPEPADRAQTVLRRRQQMVAKTDRWRLGALVETENDILVAGKRLAEAWETARRHDVGDRAVLTLAAASETTLPHEAATAYRRAIERQIGQTNRGGFEAACRLLKRLVGVEEVDRLDRHLTNFLAARGA